MRIERRLLLLQELHSRHVQPAVGLVGQGRRNGMHALFESGARLLVPCTLRGDVKTGHNFVKLFGINVRHRAE